MKKKALAPARRATVVTDTISLSLKGYWKDGLTVNSLEMLIEEAVASGAAGEQTVHIGNRNPYSLDDTFQTLAWIDIPGSALVVP